MYRCAININIAYTCGYLLNCILVLQICSGLWLVCDSLRLVPGMSVVMSVVGDSVGVMESIIRWYGCVWGMCLVSLVEWVHVLGVSCIWLLLLCHVLRGGLYCSWLLRVLGWLMGVLSGIVCVIVSVVGYIQAWGTLSYWGGVVIGSLLGCGGRLLLHGDVLLGLDVIGRYLMLHYLVGLLMIGVVLCHISCLHGTSVGGSRVDNVVDSTVGASWLLMIWWLDWLCGCVFCVMMVGWLGFMGMCF